MLFASYGSHVSVNHFQCVWSLMAGKGQNVCETIDKYVCDF